LYYLKCITESMNKFPGNLVTYNCISIVEFPKSINRKSGPHKSDKSLQTTSLNATHYLHLLSRTNHDKAIEYSPLTFHGSAEYRHIGKNVKWCRHRPGVAQTVGRGIALLFRDRGTRRGVSGQQHAPAVFYLRESFGTHFTGGWVGPRAGLDGRKISSPQGFDSGPTSP